MVRSLYSGVTGMKAHQTRLDVIGNNIANVNTIGFKSSSVTFRDVYYQSLRGAAAGDGTQGGLNASQVGYGANIGSIDRNMSQSASSLTGNSWDVSIGGEGFFQVQDADGNIYYTRAGKLGYDNMGYLIDSNGNYVLGTNAINGSVVGQKPGHSRIQMSVPSVNPTKANWTNEIGGVKYTLTAGTESKDGNVTVNILSKDLPAGKAAEAKVGSSGITVYLGSDYTFANITDLNAAINDAITEANGGPHPAGNFTLSADPDNIANLTGKQITENAGAPTPGQFTKPAADTIKDNYGFSFLSTGENFGPGGNITDITITDSWTAANPIHAYTVEVTIGTKTYRASITPGQLTEANREVQLKAVGGEVGDTVTMSFPDINTLLKGQAVDAGAAHNFPKGAAPANPLPTAGGAAGTPWNGYSVTAATPSRNLGLSSNAFTLKDGTEGGAQTLADISGFKIGADGVITATHRGVSLELGRVDIATFQNPMGLEQVGGTYFAATGNSGEPQIVEPGSSGTGTLAGSSLELSNVDLSSEFADMITTQRGFQANSRMITVSDTLLEELINLKR